MAISLSLPLANPECLTADDLVEYVSSSGYQVPRGERGTIVSIAADAREAPVTVTFETSGRRQCWPIELRLLARGHADAGQSSVVLDVVDRIAAAQEVPA